MTIQEEIIKKAIRDVTGFESFGSCSWTYAELLMLEVYNKAYEQGRKDALSTNDTKDGGFTEKQK